MKYKWDIMGEEKSKSGNPDPANFAIDEILEEVQREEILEKEELEEAKLRSIFDMETARLDFSKRRATDVKNNARVIFPRNAGNLENEAILEMLRLELMGAYRGYINEFCNERGEQKSNLSRNQLEGLKSLKKRMKEGEIVILPTDKSGNFCVMSRETFLRAGLVHTKKDTEVEIEDIKSAQTELNGAVSMMLKIFRVGKSWDHQSRIRESMLGGLIQK